MDTGFRQSSTRTAVKSDIILFFPIETDFHVVVPEFWSKLYLGSISLL